MENNHSPNATDYQYHELLARVMRAPLRGDRTGTGTRSIFGEQMRFSDLDKRFPLLTTKKVHMKSVIHELIWMLRGETNIKYLVDNGVNIWNAWPLKYYNQNVEVYHGDTTKEWFERQIKEDAKFAERWGDCGPVYGRQWRKWSTFNERSEEYGQARDAIDQIADVLQTLRTNPESRRMIVSAWNVADIPEMIPAGLPPCHLLMQFYTREIPVIDRFVLFERDWDATTPLPDEFHGSLKISNALHETFDKYGTPRRYLDCQVYIRSNDLFLGAPFNIAQYAMLTHMMAKCVNMVPGELVYTIGDAHIYANHMEQVQEQLSRPSAGPEPRLELVCDRPINDPAEFEYADVRLIDYVSHAAIKAPIAV